MSKFKKNEKKQTNPKHFLFLSKCSPNTLGPTANQFRQLLNDMWTR